MWGLRAAAFSPLTIVALNRRRAGEPFCRETDDATKPASRRDFKPLAQVFRPETGAEGRLAGS
jgi:hypothetical protein